MNNSQDTKKNVIVVLSLCTLIGASIALTGFYLVPSTLRGSKVSAEKRTPEQEARRQASEEQRVAAYKAHSANLLSRNPQRVQSALAHVKGLEARDLDRCSWAPLLVSEGKSQEAYECLKAYIHASAGTFVDKRTIKLYAELADRHGSAEETRWIQEHYSSKAQFRVWRERQEDRLAKHRNSPIGEMRSRYRQSVTDACAQGRKAFPDHLAEINQMENELLALYRPGP